MDPVNFSTPKFLWPRRFLDQIFLWTQNFWTFNSFRTPLFLDTTLFGTQSFGLNIYSYNISNPAFLPTFFHGFKKKFQNRKSNYPNRKWNMFSHFKATNQKTSLQKGCYFSHFEASDQKTSFTKCFSFDPRVSKLIFKTGNGIIQTGNGIISPTSMPLIKKLLLQNLPHLFQGVQN